MRLSCGIGRLLCVQWPMGARTRSGSQRLCLDDAEKAFVYPLGTCSGDGWEPRETHERGLHPRGQGRGPILAMPRIRTYSEGSRLLSSREV